MMLEIVQFLTGCLIVWFVYKVGYEVGRTDGAAEVRKWTDR